MSLKRLEKGIYYAVGKLENGNIVQGCHKNCRYCFKSRASGELLSYCNNPKITVHYGSAVECAIAICTCMIIYNSRIL